MTDGRFLNLPVLEEDGTLAGCVDVLKLTYATLEQVSHVYPAATLIYAFYRYHQSGQKLEATLLGDRSGLGSSHLLSMQALMATPSRSCLSRTPQHHLSRRRQHPQRCRNTYFEQTRQ